jgi:cbb3-type cytochrome oxidase subunit 3
MRLTKILFILGLLLVVMAPVLVLADQYGYKDAASAGSLPTTIAGASSVPEAIGNIISIALSFLGIVFFGLIFYAGVLWMIALGESGKVDKAKNLIETAIIGLIIVIGAYAISTFVFNKLVDGGEASTVAPPVVDCAVADTDGKDCGANKVCFDTECVDKCSAQEPGGECMPATECTTDWSGTPKENTDCPYASGICCVAVFPD